MPKPLKPTFGSRAKSWAATQKLHGPQAFFRFVVFTFLDCLSKESDDFIFKGGNLLWLYTRTPRQTIDLDLVTRTISQTNRVKALIEKACQNGDGIVFKLISIKEVSGELAKGAAVTLGYHTEDGASNRIDLDIVYALPTDTGVMISPLPEKNELQVATMENIIADKISACHSYGGGNTRMKDYDDLWRLASEKRKVDFTLVAKLLKVRSISAPFLLQTEWLNDEIKASWKRHIIRYKDLPRDLSDVISQINNWIVS